MIYTVTLNPALDYVVQMKKLAPGAINRNTSENIYCGGKGINVSWILQELGIRSTVLGFIAGFTGKALAEGLQAHGINTDLITVQKGMTRINVKIKAEEETEINGMGPQIEAEDFEQLKQKMHMLVPGDMLVISGSIPSCMHSDAYEKLLEHVPEGVGIVVDAEKDLLLKILRYHPFLIKPNVKELGDMLEMELKTEEDILAGARKLQELGARNVLVSMAKDGALLLGEDGSFLHMCAPSGTVVNSVGAGDSMVAGFLAGWTKTQRYDEALKLGTACGSATAFHSGLAAYREIMDIYKSL
ncbi:MAG: 1-phosphofructokinase [Solobacterium sp.]|nr:1-phosphofructokinase [Solobacterium sp.]